MHDLETIKMLNEKASSDKTIPIDTKVRTYLEALEQINELQYSLLNNVILARDSVSKDSNSKKILRKLSRVLDKNIAKIEDVFDAIDPYGKIIPIDKDK